MPKKKDLSPKQREGLLNILKTRFEKNMNRHKGLEWDDIEKRLKTDPIKLWSLNEMESTGGEPDVVTLGKELVFCDCSPETPVGRRNTCYDREGQKMREDEGINPEGNAIDMAAEMGIELLSEGEYRELQKLREFDLKTSTWVRTPEEIRKLGGALFCDRRYDHVFTYHNSAQTFYRVRGFRGKMRVD